MFPGANDLRLTNSEFLLKMSLINVKKQTRFFILRNK